MSQSRDPSTQSGSPERAKQVVESEAFRGLVSRRWRMSMVLLVLLFVSYYGYILLVATNKELVSRKIGESMTLAIPLGIAVIGVALALTAIYVGWANRSYDPEVERLKGVLRR